ncbi:MAG: CCA tRNA nucleotidyltransferase [Pikeienuella sp.]
MATDGRRAVIAFANTLEEDAQRRDFTMNALYANGDGDVVDPTGEGVADLTARRIRFIGNAAGRIEEDYLRILRFFRFHAQFAITEFDQGALSACNTHASGLRHISRERILAEMLKLLRVANPEPTLAAMSGPLAVAMPGAKVFSGLVAVESALDLRPGELRRLAALGGAGGLPLSRAQKATLTAIKASCEMMGAGARLSAIAHAYGGDAVRDAVALFALSGGAVPPDWADQIALAQAAVMPITARDLIALGRHPGPALGAELKRLEAAWVASDFTLSAEQLLAGQP